MYCASANPATINNRLGKHDPFILYVSSFGQISDCCRVIEEMQCYRRAFIFNIRGQMPDYMLGKEPGSRLRREEEGTGMNQSL